MFACLILKSLDKSTKCFGNERMLRLAKRECEQRVLLRAIVESLCNSVTAEDDGMILSLGISSIMNNCDNA